LLRWYDHEPGFFRILFHHWRDGAATAREGTTNIPAGTFIPAKLPEGEGALMYWPEQNAFLALFAPEFNALHFQADEHSKKIAALQGGQQEGHRSGGGAARCAKGQCRRRHEEGGGRAQQGAQRDAAGQ
jgi:hypothetical protein